MKISKNIQGSDEWLNDRKLHMTGSHATAIASAGAGLKTYINELLAEYYSTAPKEHFENAHTIRGNELEPQARALYELENKEVNETGFIELDEYTGGSPDGLVGKNGMIEIKCPQDTKHFNFILNKKIDTGYIWQMQFYLYITGRKWCDFISYNPNFKKSLVIVKIKRDEEKIEKLKNGLEVGKKLIEELKAKYEK